MRTRYYFHFFIPLLLTFSLFFPITSGAAGQDSDSFSEKKTIRVGATEMGGFSHTDENRKRTGILYDSLEEISKYTNWKIEYIDGEMQDIVNMLTAGEIDILGCINKDEATMEMFDFPEIESGYIYTCIISKLAHNEYISNDFSTFDNLRLGVYSKAKSRMAELEAFCKNNNLSYQLIMYDDYDAYSNCLESGDVDARLDLNIDLKQDEKILSRFAPRPYYFAVAKGKSDIVRELNQALEMINTFEPEFNSTLYRKYYDNRLQKLELSQNEQAFITSSPSFKVVCMSEWPPFCYYNEKNKKYQGISLDIINEISILTGLTFEPVYVTDFDTAIEMVASGNADIFCGTYNSEYIHDEYKLTHSVPYLNTQTVAVTKSNLDAGFDSLSGKRAALTYGYEKPYTFNSSEIIFYNKTDDAISAVKNGTADFTLVSYIAAESYERRNGITNLSFTPVSNANTVFSFSYKPDVSSLLISIIDKAIYSISDSDKHSITLENTIVDSPVSFDSYLYSNPYQVFSAVFALCLLLVFIISIIIYLRIRLLKQAALIGDAYRLVSDMANEYLFEYNYSNSEMRLPDEICKVTGLSSIVKGDTCPDEIKPIFNYFISEELQESKIIDFEFTLPNKETESFRAICSILIDDRKKPLRGIGKITSIQAETLAKRELEARANSDGLTGLYTRNYCETLVNEFLQTAPPGQKTAFIMIDLDSFKSVNDTLGHLGGDEVLKFLAGCILPISEENICGRFGGDEFFLLIKDLVNVDELPAKINKLCRYMDRIFEYDGNTCRISISVGAVCCEADNQSFTSLLTMADQALYKAKLNGRNGYVVTDENQNKDIIG